MGFCGLLAVVAAPVILPAVGFTSGGIAAGSYAAGMMSTAAIAKWWRYCSRKYSGCSAVSWSCRVRSCRYCCSWWCWCLSRGCCFRSILEDEWYCILAEQFSPCIKLKFWRLIHWSVGLNPGHDTCVSLGKTLITKFASIYSASYTHHMMAELYRKGIKEE